jgi:hypothetical protein
MLGVEQVWKAFCTRVQQKNLEVFKKPIPREKPTVQASNNWAKKHYSIDTTIIVNELPII